MKEMPGRSRWVKGCHSLRQVEEEGELAEETGEESAKRSMEATPSTQGRVARPHRCKGEVADSA